MPRGRPPKSVIRQNMINILQYVSPLNGYTFHKIYCSVFDAVTLRVIYYHLRKGVSYGEFIVKNVSVEKGHYSWGSNAEKIFYILGTQSVPQPDESLRVAVQSFRKTNVSV